jgi:multidrug efflux pump subunit AcrB
MNGMIAWWARNPVAANLLMILCFIGALLAYPRLERETFPTALFNGVSVTMAWPGASPQEIEEQIILRIEESIIDLDGIKNLTATAREGFGSVNIETYNTVDIVKFNNDVKLRIDAINNFPDSAFRPQVSEWRSQEWYMGLAVHGDVDRRELKRITEQLRDEIALLPGASLARVEAVLPEEVSIEVSEEGLRRYGLTFDEIARAVRVSSLNASSGTIRTAVGDVQLQSRNLADTAAQFEGITLRQLPDGARIRLGEVARVVDGFVDADLNSNFNGEPMAMIALISTEVMDITRTAREVKKFIAEANERLPDAVSVSLWWDDSKIYNDRMRTIVNNALSGALLVLVILLLFLRPIVAFWTTVGVLTSFAGAIAVLPFFGVSLNILSLFAFLIVIGIVVDDAIVVGENIHKEVETGRREGLDAATVGTQLVAKPVFFGVITTILAFMPWMLLSGPERQFTAQISFVVMAALAFSLIESFFILPAHLAHMKPQKWDDSAMGRFTRFQRGIADSLLWFARVIYKPVIEFCIQRRYSVVAGFVGLFILATGLLSHNYVPFKFMPEIENEAVQVNIRLPEGTPFARVEQVELALETAQQKLRTEYETQFPDAETSVIVNWAAIASTGSVQAWLMLSPPEVRPGRTSTKAIAERFRELVGPIPDAEDIQFQSTLNRQDAGISFAVNHRDLSALRAAVADLKAQLSTYAAVSDVRDNMSAAAEEARFSLKPGAEALGLSLADITRQVRQAYFGEELMRLPREGEDVRVMLRYPTEDRRSLDTLQNLRVRTADGREVPLPQVADISFEPGINRIQRRERQRSASVSADVPTDARGDVMKDLNENFFPAWEERHPGVSRGALGESQGQAEFMAEVSVLMALVLVGMYILLAIAFNSYSQPALIMTAVPFGFAGAVFGHYITGIDMAMFSIFGIGAAAGVVINDNLVLIDYVNKLRANGAGAMRALVEAAVNRFRPILLTSLTTVAGMSPILLERSTDAEFLKPMVVSLVAGVAFALFLTLMFVPALYCVGIDVKRFFAGLWSGQRQAKVGATYTGEIAIDEEIPRPHTPPHPAE